MNDSLKPQSEAADIKRALKSIICRELDLEDIEADQIRDDDPLFGDKFGLDSIDAVEIVFQVKAHFGVVIRDMKEGRRVLQTVNTLAEFIEANRNA